MWLNYHNWDDEIRRRDNIALDLIKISHDSILMDSTSELNPSIRKMPKNQNEFYKILDSIKNDKTFKNSAWYWAEQFQPFLKIKGRSSDDISPIASALLLLANNRRLLDSVALSKIVEINKNGFPGSYINAPLLGKVHINDMTFLSGYAQSFLLLVLCFFLFSEKDNLRLFIASLNTSTKRIGYQILSAHQVLTIPRDIDETRINYRKGFFSLIAKLLFLIPMAVQIYLTVEDSGTRLDGYVASINLTDTSLLLGKIFTIMVVILSLATFSASYMVDRDWENFRRSIISPENPVTIENPVVQVNTPIVIDNPATQ